MASDPAAAQYGCHEPTSNEWLDQGFYRGPGAEVRDDFVQPVTNDLPRAVAMLSSAQFVRLSANDVRRFLGPGFAIPRGRKLEPHLVRAVFPTDRPKLGVSWDNNGNLFVFAGGLGCAPFSKHPIVIFLDREPQRIFVSASAAL
jgi:hypothetical protein